MWNSLIDYIPSKEDSTKTISISFIKHLMVAHIDYSIYFKTYLGNFY